jgi:predicted site-specific integrase-resolvase
MATPDRITADHTADHTTIQMPRLLTWRSACAAIGGEKPVCRSTLDKLVKEGHITVVRLSAGVVRYDAGSIADYLTSVTFRRKP